VLLGKNHFIATFGGEWVEQALPKDAIKLPIITNQKSIFIKHLIHIPIILKIDEIIIVTRTPLFSINQFVGIANIKYPIAVLA